MHLPNPNEVSLDFLRDCLAGRKKLFKNREVNVANVPRLPEFRVDLMYKYAREDPTARQYLPEPKSDNSCPVSKQFLFKVSNQALT